jgi:hypothetical protein
MRNSVNGLRWTCILPIYSPSIFGKAGGGGGGQASGFNKSTPLEKSNANIYYWLEVLTIKPLLRTENSQCILRFLLQTFVPVAAAEAAGAAETAAVAALPNPNPLEAAGVDEPPNMEPPPVLAGAVVLPNSEALLAGAGMPPNREAPEEAGAGVLPNSEGALLAGAGLGLLPKKEAPVEAELPVLIGRAGALPNAKPELLAGVGVGAAGAIPPKLYPAAVWLPPE